MWKCECGEFNNEESDYCVRCNKLRVIKERSGARQREPMNTDTMFRRIQEFILLDVAVIGLLVVYCFWRASQRVEIEGPDGQVFSMPAVSFDSVIPLLMVIILQMGLLVHLLRAFYRTAVNSERNSIFLQKIYETYEGIAEEEEEEAPAGQPLVKPPTTSTPKERRGPSRTGPPRGRPRPRDSAD
jgi:hypothetical protein